VDSGQWIGDKLGMEEEDTTLRMINLLQHPKWNGAAI
jgi:hypothetical protein